MADILKEFLVGTNDAAAASAGFRVGGLYRDTSVAAGVSVLAVWMA